MVLAGVLLRLYEKTDVNFPAESHDDCPVNDSYHSNFIIFVKLQCSYMKANAKQHDKLLRFWVYKQTNKQKTERANFWSCQCRQADPGAIL